MSMDTFTIHRRGKPLYDKPRCNKTFRMTKDFSTPDTIASGQVNLDVTNLSIQYTVLVLQILRIVKRIWI